MRTRRLDLVILGSCLIGLLLWIPSCATNPVTGKSELMLLSESDEVKLGQETDPQIVKEYGIYEDRKLIAYLNGVCQHLGKISHRPNLTYHFKILDASVVNAFAVPGGYVYFTRGILATLNSEAELAGVMGHEIGHITARHSAQQYSRARDARRQRAECCDPGAVFLRPHLVPSRDHHPAHQHPHVPGDPDWDFFGSKEGRMMALWDLR